MHIWAEEMWLMALGVVVEFKATNSKELLSPNLAPLTPLKPGTWLLYCPPPRTPQFSTAWILKHCVMYSEEVWREEVGTRPHDSNPEYSGKAARPIQQG